MVVPKHMLARPSGLQLLASHFPWQMKGRSWYLGVEVTCLLLRVSSKPIMLCLCHLLTWWVFSANNGACDEHVCSTDVCLCFWGLCPVSVLGRAGSSGSSQSSRHRSSGWCCQAPREAQGLGIYEMHMEVVTLPCSSAAEPESGHREGQIYWMEETTSSIKQVHCRSHKVDV